MPRIYVGTYAKYNNGSIAGAWIDLEQYPDAEVFHAVCRFLHRDEADPELMFQDWEGIPEGMVSETHLSDDLWAWLELDEDDRDMLAVYRGHVDQAGTLEQANEAYAGTFETAEDWAAQYMEDTGALEKVPENLRMYFDYKAFARDAGFDGTAFVEVSYKKIYVFYPT